MPADVQRIFLIRHGEVEADWQGRIYGSLDIPLSEEGKGEARRIASLLQSEPLGVVVSSGLERAEYGAACLREARALPRVDDGELRELDRGDWAGMLLDELERVSPGAWASWFRTPGSSKPPGGESLADLLARAWPRMEHWAQSSHGSSLAIVTHGWVIRVVLCRVLGIALDLAPRLDVRTADLYMLERSGQGEPLRLAGFALDRVPTQLSE